MAPAHSSVPTAWGVESERAFPQTAPGIAMGNGGPALADEYGRNIGNAPGPAPGAPYPNSWQQPEYQGGAPPGYQGVPNAAFMQPRGPQHAGIRDSLAGISRRDSPEPGQHGRSGSRDLRDPSPKTSANANRRNDSPIAYRGESPLRLLNRSGRGSSPGAAARPGENRQPTATGGYNPQYGLGFCLGGIRAGPSGGPGPAPQGRVAPPGGGPGMGAFRSGGPVRAKADLLGPGADPRAAAEVRRSRPQTAPTQRASGSRPSSPLGGGRASGSRPSSPQVRAPSPQTSQQRAPSPGMGMGPIPQGPYPGLAGIDKTKQRSLSSHMRRAPSPTPAFNRNASPSRPRWRS